MNKMTSKAISAEAATQKTNSFIKILHDCILALIHL